MNKNSWEPYIRDFANYLRLERSLSQNSIDAYVRDMEKLAQFTDLKLPKTQPADITSRNLQAFLKHLNELGMSPHSQARILSGIKGFYKYLLFEERISKDPTQLIEGPRLGRHLPDTLDYQEIVSLLEAIDLSSPEGGRNRAMLEVLYSSGLRVSELVELRRAN